MYIDNTIQISFPLPVANQGLPGPNIQLAGGKAYLEIC